MKSSHEGEFPKGIGTSRPRLSTTDQPAPRQPRSLKTSWVVGAWWAHFEFTRINIEPIILKNKIEDSREAGAFTSVVDSSAATNKSQAIRAAFDDPSTQRGIADSWASSLDFVDAAGLRPQDRAFVGLSNFPSFDRNDAGEGLSKFGFGFF